jgi:hypothetical protein
MQTAFLFHVQLHELSLAVLINALGQRTYTSLCKPVKTRVSYVGYVV